MQVRLDQLTKRFDAAVAVDGVSLAVEPGELLVVAGARGAGKSTLLKLLAGTDEPTSGAVFADGAALAPGPAADRPIVFGSLDAAGVPAGTAAPSAAPPVPAPPAAASAPAPPAAASAPAPPAAAPGPADAEGRGPACVLLDEPLAGLRGAARAAARDRLRALPDALGAAVVCALDAADEADATAVADRIALLERGRLRQCGAPAELLDAPVDEFVAAFFGRPRINLVPGILEKDGQAILLGNQTVSLAGRIEETFCRDVTIGVRPTDIRLTRDGAGLRGRVRATAPAAAADGAASADGADGGAALVEVAVEGWTVRALDADAGSAAALGVGDAVRVRLDARRLVVFDDHGVRLEQR